MADTTSHTPIIFGMCQNDKCSGIASLDHILFHGSCPDCQARIQNVTEFADLADAVHLRDALNGILANLENLTSNRVPLKQWRAALLSLQGTIEHALAENQLDLDESSVDPELAEREEHQIKEIVEIEYVAENINTDSYEKIRE